MAQHIPLEEQTEKKAFDYCKKIVEKVNPYWERMEEYKKFPVMKKEVMKLGREYNPQGRAIDVCRFNLEDKSWDERKTGGFDLRKDACLEVHFTYSGKVTNIYYPV